MTPEFLLTTLIVVATPGAGALCTPAAGVSRGWQAGVIAAFGATYLVLAGSLAAPTR